MRAVYLMAIKVFLTTQAARHALIIIVIAAFASTVAAKEAEDYAKGLQGTWRGGGIVIRDAKGKKIKLRCSAKNTLDLKVRTLNMKGRCGSSLGSRPLIGVFAYSLDGKKFENVSLKIAGRGGVSTAILQDQRLTLDAVTSLESGEVSINRNVISRGDDEYSIDLYSDEDGEYISRGTLIFNKRPSS